MLHCWCCRDLVYRRHKAGPPLCLECRRRGRLVSLSKALAKGFSLATLRAVGASVITGGTPYFASARLHPQLLDPAAARRDVARLRRDRRDARPLLDTTLVVLARDPTLRPWNTGMHVEAVSRGLLSPQEAVEVARAAAAVWAFLRRPDVLAARACASDDVRATLDAVLAARLGPRVLHAAGELPPPDVRPRGVTVAVVNRMLAERRPPSPGDSFGLLRGARCVAWSTVTHAFVCSAQTRQAVRHLLLHLCRLMGVTAGSVVAVTVLRIVFAPDEKVEERAVTSNLTAGSNGPPGLRAEPLAEVPPPPVEPPPATSNVEPTLFTPREPRQRWGFFLLQQPDEVLPSTHDSL